MASVPHKLSSPRRRKTNISAFATGSSSFPRRHWREISNRPSTAVTVVHLYMMKGRRRSRNNGVIWFCGEGEEIGVVVGFFCRAAWGRQTFITPASSVFLHSLERQWNQTIHLIIFLLFFFSCSLLLFFISLCMCDLEEIRRRRRRRKLKTREKKKKGGFVVYLGGLWFGWWFGDNNTFYQFHLSIFLFFLYFTNGFPFSAIFPLYWYHYTRLDFIKFHYMRLVFFFVWPFPSFIMFFVYNISFLVK